MTLRDQSATAKNERERLAIMSTKYLFAALEAYTGDPLAKIVLIALADAADDNGYSFKSRTTLAKQCEISVSTVKRKIGVLLCEGYLEDVEYRFNKGLQTSNGYRLLGPEDMRTNGKPRGVTVNPRGGQAEPPGGSHRPTEPITEPISEPIRERKRFSAPSVEQVTQYVNENGYNVDPDYFVDWNSSKGWKVGKANTPMKDWKAAVRTWHKRAKNENTRRLNGSGQNQGRLSAAGAVRAARERQRLRESSQ